MDGHEYEYACAQYLKRNGFTKVQVTKARGDQGIDIIATKGKKYGIQCKYYSGAVGNKAVQEAYAGSKFYGCDVAVVMTNNTFTKSAKELAEKLSVELWENKVIGVEETDWNKKKLSVGDLDSILQKIDDKRNLLSDKQYKALRTVEIALCNFRNGIVDDYYNKHPELSISEADYRMPKG